MAAQSGNFTKLVSGDLTVFSTIFSPKSANKTAKIFHNFIPCLISHSHTDSPAATHHTNITMPAKQFVDDKIAGKKVMVFSKSGCPFCTKAKEQFKKLLASGKLSKEDYEVLEIEGRSDCGEIQDYLKSITGARSVSIMILINRTWGWHEMYIIPHGAADFLN